MAIDAVSNYSVGLQQTPKASLKSQQSFTSKPEVDEEKSNATKYMIGATALAAVIGLGIAGYKGKLGKGIQEFLGGAEKAVKDGAQNASESTGSASKPMTEGAEQATQKAEEVPISAGKPANPILKGEEAVNKYNEYFKSQGLDNVVFIPKNDTDKVILIKKDKDGGYVKKIFNKEDFQINTVADANYYFLENSIPAEASVYISRSKDGQKIMEKTSLNGIKTTIEKDVYEDGTKTVSSLVKDPVSNRKYEKNSDFDSAGNVVDVYERVYEPKSKLIIKNSEAGFAEAKKEVLEKLKKGVEEPRKVEEFKFVPKNNSDQTVVIKKSGKTGYSKQIFSNDSSEELSSVRLEKYDSGAGNVEKIAKNGTKTTIRRSPITGGGIQVSTNVSKDDYVYRKSVTIDKDKKVVRVEENVMTPDILLNSSDSGFAEAKKEVLAKLREGLNWSDEPIRKTPQA